MAKVVTTQRVGNILGLAGLIALPLLIGFVVFQTRRK